MGGLDHKESWVQKNWCFWTVVLEKTLESPLDCKETQPDHPKGNQSSIFIGRTEMKLKVQYFGHLMRRTDSFERPWCWGKLKAGEGDDRGWDGWMASPTQMTWVWVNSGSWWMTGSPGMLQSVGLQRVGHDWATELNWTETDFSLQLSNLNSYSLPLGTMKPLRTGLLWNLVKKKKVHTLNISCVISDLYSLWSPSLGPIGPLSLPTG